MRRIEPEFSNSSLSLAALAKTVTVLGALLLAAVWAEAREDRQIAASVSPATSDLG